MYAPYTDHPDVAFFAAQVGTGALLTALGTPILRNRLGATVAWNAAVWLTAFAPLLAAGSAATQTLHWLLAGSAALLVAALWLGTSRSRFVRLAPVVALPLLAGYFFTDFDRELCASYLLLAGAMLGSIMPRVDADASIARDALGDGPVLSASRAQDLFFVLLGTAAAALVSHYVLLRSGDGSDETAYTYQAAVYAKGRLYGQRPECLDALRNYWIFWRGDRMFAQYQPGWPLFLVPFVWLKAIWLGGPFSFGLVCMATARLARRAVALLPRRTRTAVLRGGFVAGMSVVLSVMMLINGGSRFPHVLVAALFAACVEVIWVLAHTTDRRRATTRGLLAGTIAGALILIRVVDSLLLATGPLVCLLLAIRRGRAHPRGLLAAGLATIPWVAFLFWSAHAQVGAWGKLPYQLGNEFYPWMTIDFSPPKLHLWKWSLPLAAGAYCWWPLSPGLGIAGLVLLSRERSARKLAFTLALSGLAVFLFYGLLELGRGGDFGYGPRYTLVLVVPMAVGTALLVEAVLDSLREYWARSMQWLLLLVAIGGTAAIGAELFPSTYRLLERVSAPERAARAAGLERAIVVIPDGVTPYGPTNVTKNLPIELYDPPVIFANDLDTRCLRRAYPDRTVYRAVGPAPIRLEPTPPDALP